MTRRQALLASMVALAATMRTVQANQELRLSPGAATTLVYDLSTFSAYTFRLGAQEVIFTPEELMAALMPTGRDPRR